MDTPKASPGVPGTGFGLGNQTNQSWSKAVDVSWGDFGPQGAFGSLETFLVAASREMGATDIKWVEGRDAGKYPTKHALVLQREVEQRQFRVWNQLIHKQQALKKMNIVQQVTRHTKPLTTKNDLV